MGLSKTVSVLKGLIGEHAYGLTWVPEDALRALTQQDDHADVAETLAAVAVAMRLDAVVVPAAQPWAAEAVNRLLAANVAALWTVDGVLSRAGRELGWTQALQLSAARPGELAIAIAEGLHGALEEARAGVVAGASALVVADELAGESGWLVSPDFALEALMPSYRRLSGVGDWPAAFHSDGDIRALYPSLRHAGYSAVHVATAGERSTASAFHAARASGLVPMGGIEARALFTDGARSAGMSAALVASGGGAVVCDDGGMTSAEELAAYSSAIDAARKVDA